MTQIQQPMGFSGSPMTAAILGPDILARQLRMQQEAQFGQQMLQDGQQTPQGQMVSGHYVAPSITQYLANGLKSYVGRKVMNDLPNQVASLGQAQMQGVNNLFGVGPQASTPASTDPSQPQTFPVGASGQPGSNQPSPQALASGLGGSQSPVSPQNQAMAGVLRGQSQMPLLPGRSAADSARAYMMMGPVEYMKAVTSQGAPTDIVKNMIAMGIDPTSQMGRQIIAANVNKTNYIAPTNVRPGGTVFDNVTGKPIFTAPNSNGSQIVRDANGNPSMSQVPGAQDVNVNNSVASATGPATFRTQTINYPGGTNALTTDRAIGEQVQNQNVARGIRNNNPGNLRPQGQFAQYPDMQTGLTALDNNLQTYGKQGINTLTGVISKWAPPTVNGKFENNTQAYIQDVSKRLGLDPNQKIDLSNPLVRQTISTAIALHENGASGVFGGQSPVQTQDQQVPGIQVQGEGTIAANQQLGKDQAKELMTSRAAAINATNELTNIAAERKAITAGTFGGTGAQAKLNAVKFAQGWLGISLDPEKVSNTDYLVSALGGQMLSNIKKLGTQPTDADRNALEAIVGTIGKDPQALNRLIDFQEMMANRTINRHNDLVAQANKGGIQSAFDMNVSPQTGMPRPQEPATPAPSGFKIIGVR